MIWLIWRQHRGELLGAGVLLAVLGLFLLLHGIPMYDAYERDGVETCQQLMFSANFDESCFQTMMAFENQYSDLPQNFSGWLPFLPMLAGMLIGAPLLAREYEQGTWQLAWTQGVTRTRWLATKLAVLIGGVVAVSAVFAAGMSWWLGPLSPQAFTTAKFNHAVLVFPGYVMVAVAIGILAGVVFRRTLVAAAVTVAGYLAVRLPLEFWGRPNFRTPLTTTDYAVAERGWVVHDLGAGQVAGVGQDGTVAPAPEPISYHPDDRFWEFQLIETAILAGVTVALLLITWRLVLGRKAPSTRPPAEAELEPVA